MTLMQEPVFSTIVLLARICLCAVFLVSGIHKAFWYGKAVEEFKLASIPLIPLTLPLVIALHITAGICILVGVYVAQAALILSIFTVLTTLWVFPFWRRTGTERLIQSRIAMANLALAGGLLLLSVSSPGQYILFM
jgi:putative oxidoreductase